PAHEVRPGDRDHREDDADADRVAHRHRIAVRGQHDQVRDEVDRPADQHVDPRFDETAETGLHQALASGWLRGTVNPAARTCPPPPYCFATSLTSSPSSADRRLNTRPCSVSQ